MKIKLMVILPIALGLSGPALATPLKVDTAASGTLQMSDWFSGSVDEALAIARQQKKVVLLFWTAIWCPYCNEIKSSVFARADVRNLLKQVVPVYLDGDSAQAQQYSEKFAIGGFPTILFLNSEGTEITRFSENLTLEEFQQTFESVLASDSPIDEVLQKAHANTIKAHDWTKLAMYQWGDAETEIGKNTEKTLNELRFLYENCPKSMDTEKALFASALIAQAASVEKERLVTNASLQNIENWVKKNWKSLHDQTRRTRKALFATRSLTLNASEGWLPWLFEFSSAKDLELAQKRLSHDLVTLRNMQDLPVYARLDTHSEEVALAKESWKKPEQQKKLDDRLVKSTRKALETLVANAQSPLVRQPTILRAAHLLESLNNVTEAQELLKNEIPASETPYYYQATLSSLSEKSGDFVGALEWSEKSANSATGRMTKARWLARDIGFKIRLKDKVPTEKIEPALTQRIVEYFTFAFSQSDAFVSTSLKRSESLAKKIKPWSESPQNQKLVQNWLMQCDVQDSKNKENCRTLMDSLKNEKKI